MKFCHFSIYTLENKRCLATVRLCITLHKDCRRRQQGGKPEITITGGALPIYASAIVRVAHQKAKLPFSGGCNKNRPISTKSLPYARCPNASNASIRASSHASDKLDG